MEQLKEHIQFQLGELPVSMYELHVQLYSKCTIRTRYREKIVNLFIQDEGEKKKNNFV